MAGNPWKLQFVDAVSASPTLRLDVNDGAQWICKGFNPAPPRLRRSVSSNAMRDGGIVSSSSYDMRVLTLDLMLQTNTQDQSATELQKLARELDRPSNILKYQPDGASKPVFFSLYRSDWADLFDVMSSQESIREFTIELLAAPDARGLTETFNSTFSMDGAVAGFEYTTPTILGDLAAPLVMDITQGTTAWPYDTGSNWLVAQAVPSTLTSPVMVRQGTNATLGTNGTDTTSVTGATSAHYNTDYKLVSFATVATMADRITANSPTLAAGTYRLFMRAYNTTAPAVNQVRVNRVDSGGNNLEAGDTVNIDDTTIRMWDLGLYRFPYGVADAGVSDGLTTGTAFFRVQAARSSGAASLRIDALLWLPVDMDDAVSSTSAYFYTPFINLSGAGTMRIDGPNDRSYVLDGGSVRDQYAPPTRSGALPMLYPGCSNKLWLLPISESTPADTVPFTVTYNPRYLFVRPSAS